MNPNKVQVRKHHSQMRPVELLQFELELRKLAPRLTFTAHARERMAQKFITYEHVVSAWALGHIVEVSQTSDGDVRCLLRHDGQTEATCIVVSLKSAAVTTVWKNRVTDKHTTLDLGSYDANQRIAPRPQPAEGRHA